jgi:hypothetical protein
VLNLGLGGSLTGMVAEKMVFSGVGCCCCRTRKVGIRVLFG